MPERIRGKKIPAATQIAWIDKLKRGGFSDQDAKNTIEREKKKMWVCGPCFEDLKKRYKLPEMPPTGEFSYSLAHTRSVPAAIWHEFMCQMVICKSHGGKAGYWVDKDWLEPTAPEYTRIPPERSLVPIPKPGHLAIIPTRALPKPPPPPPPKRRRVIPLGSEAGKVTFPPSEGVVEGHPPKREALPPPQKESWLPRLTGYLPKTRNPPVQPSPPPEEPPSEIRLTMPQRITLEICQPQDVMVNVMGSGRVLLVLKVPARFNAGFGVIRGATDRLLEINAPSSTRLQIHAQEGISPGDYEIVVEVVDLNGNVLATARLHVTVRGPKVHPPQPHIIVNVPQQPPPTSQPTPQPALTPTPAHTPPTPIPPVGGPQEIDVGQRQHPDTGEREWTIKLKREEEGKGQVQVIVHEEGSPGRRIKDASVTILQTGQHGFTDNNGIEIFTVPPNSTYTAQAEHDDYERNTGRSGLVTTTTSQIIRVSLRRKSGLGKIRGRVIDQDGTSITNVTLYLEGPTPYSLGSLDGNFEFVDLQPGTYKLRAEHKDYTPLEAEKEVQIEGSDTKRVILRLKRKEGLKEKVGGFKKGWKKGESKVQKGYPIFTVKGLKENWWRFAIAIIATIALYFILYKPLFDALGVSLGVSNPILSIVLPILTAIIIFFLIKPPEKGVQWGALTLAIILSLGTMAGLYFAPQWDEDISFLRARYFLFGIPLAVFFIIWKMAQGEGTLGKTLIRVSGILLLIGFLVVFVSLAKGGKLTQMDTYLKTFDILKLVGVPADTVEGMKEGVRNTLSFLQFKGAEPTKPEAKKIGGFEAIELKFGSRYNDFLLPTLFARMDYTLPVTVVNPNTVDSQIKPVKDFYIDEIFLVNESDQRIICGEINTCSKNLVDEKGDVIYEKGDKRFYKTAEGGRAVYTDKDGKPDDTSLKPVSNACDLALEEEKLISVDLRGKATRTSGTSPVGDKVGDKVDCRDVVGAYRKTVTEKPLYPIIVTVPVNDSDECKNNIQTLCSPIIENLKKYYDLYTDVTKDDPTKVITTTSIGKNNCQCKINRYYNIMDDLCFMDNNKAKVILASHYDFEVEGKGELILVKQESDRKLAPRPSITSGAGPLTITTYFVTDIWAADKPQSVKMFIQIDNDGGGTADVSKMFINGDELKGSETKIFVNKPANTVEVTECSQTPDNIFISEEGTTVVCDVEIKSVGIPGSYLTLPVIVDVEYTYSQKHSKTLDVRKAIIPDGVKEMSEEETELNTRFKDLPYYCPTRGVDDVKPLVIYNPEGEGVITSAPG